MKTRLKPGVRATAAELRAAYRGGQRNFSFVRLNGANLAGANLVGASFYYASMRNVNISRSILTHVQLKGADLSGADLTEAIVNATDIIAANLKGAKMSGADFTGASLLGANCSLADMTSVYLGNASVGRALFTGAILKGVRLSGTYFDDTDVRSFCEARNVKHLTPSHIDCRTVMKSHPHPRLKPFLVQCGVPDIFAEYMIDCARALGEPLIQNLLQSTFISFGGPDEAFARKLYDALRAHNVTVFFFPENATLGSRLGDEIFRRIQDSDRILLICSRASLDRNGVINEIQETLDREAPDGGATYLLPIMLDDYVLTDWKKTQPRLAEQVGRRIIADFRKAKQRNKAFGAAVLRVIEVLKIKRPA
jgi:hypothetical protein